MGVAADQRVERPGDAADPPLERPFALVRLELAAEPAPLVSGQDAGDMRVHRPLRGRAEERRGRPDHPVAVVQPDDVVAGVFERPQDVRRHRRAVTHPHVVEQLRPGDDGLEGVERADVDAGRAHASSLAPAARGRAAPPARRDPAAA